MQNQGEDVRTLIKPVIVLSLPLLSVRIEKTGLEINKLDILFWICLKQRKTCCKGVWISEIIIWFFQNSLWTLVDWFRHSQKLTMVHLLFTKCKVQIVNFPTERLFSSSLALEQTEVSLKGLIYALVTTRTKSAIGMLLVVSQVKYFTLPLFP